MEGVSDEKGEEKFVRKNSGKAFKSRKHDKAEKRKQRKAWEKRKREKRQKQTRVGKEPAIEEESRDPQIRKDKVREHRASFESTVEEEPRNPTIIDKVREHGSSVESAIEEQPSFPKIPDKKVRQQAASVKHLSRGKMLVELSKKRKLLNKEEEEVKMPRKVPKRTNEENRTTLSVPRMVKKSHNFKELDRDLFVVDETEKIGSGAFGRCFTAIYRNEYRVVVKEMKVKDSSKREIERAKQEVLNEASVLADLGDHPGIPHLFGVCSMQLPYYLVLQQHVVEGRSVTLSEAAATGMIADVNECAGILKQTCEVLLFVHRRGYLHNDLKGNNVVLDGARHKAILIDFGKSRKITKTKLMKPKANITDAVKKYPHIAPEIHRGDRQSTASDVYSFGALAMKVLNDAKFDHPSLKSIAERCLSTIPGKRPKLIEILKEIAN